MNVAANLENSAFYFPGNCAVVEEDRSVSYAEFNRDANKVASALAGMEVRPGENVALCAPNSYAWLAFYFGALKAGAVAVTFSHLLMKGEFLKVIGDCKPKVLFVTDDRLEHLGDYRKQGYPELVICDNGDISYARFAEKGRAEFSAINRQRQDTAAIIYTGGTTGILKGAMLTHENLQTSIFNVAHYERSTADDRSLCFLPLNHVFAQVHIMGSTFFGSGGLVLQPAFDAESLLETIDSKHVTKLCAVPTIYIRLLRLPELRKKMSSVRYCFSAAASMATEVVRDWKAETGLDIHEAYGMTESASMVTFNHYYRHVVGSVGTPVNLVEVQIRDLEGNTLKQGEKGEICICGPNITRGYLNNPEETEEAFWGNWFRSGDIGIMDENGYLYLVDRLKDMIITGGENVYPREIEEFLYTRPEVLECAVVGLPDEEYGERVTAFIVPQPGHKIKTTSKVPKRFVVVNELPKNNAGKVLKRELKEQHG